MVLFKFIFRSKINENKSCKKKLEIGFFVLSIFLLNFKFIFEKSCPCPHSVTFRPDKIVIRQLPNVYTCYREGVMKRAVKWTLTVDRLEKCSLVDVKKRKVHCRRFLSDFRCEIIEKGFKLTKKVENGWKKQFDQPIGASSAQKLVEIQQTWPPFHKIQKSFFFMLLPFHR